MNCPDCDSQLVKTFIECEDGSGWYCGWLCDCQPVDKQFEEIESMKNE